MPFSLDTLYFDATLRHFIIDWLMLIAAMPHATAIACH